MCSNMADLEKTVLVRLETATGDRNRPVSFSGGKNELLCATKVKFSDILTADSEVYLQIQDESWGQGIFIDLQDQELPSRSVIKAVEIFKAPEDVFSPDSMPSSSSSLISSPPLGSASRQTRLNPSPGGPSLIQPNDPILPTLEIDEGVDEEAMRAAATIYKKESVRQLSDYQKRINTEAQNICIKNPSMLRNRSVLLETARIKVNESYPFKKGKSRSKHYGEPSSPKRHKVNRSSRLSRMKTLEDDIKNIIERISFKQKRRQASENTKQYRICDELTEEIGTLTKDRRLLQAELALLAKKDNHSKLYYGRKSKSPMSSSTCSPHPYSDSDVDVVPNLGREDTIVLSDCSEDSNL